MSKEVVVRYLCDGIFNPNELHSVDWQNNLHTLGLIFAMNDRSKVSYELLDSIAGNNQLNPACRGYSLLKILDFLFNDSIKITEGWRPIATNLIKQLEIISELILLIKDEIGMLKEKLIEKYSKIFAEFVHRFSLNDNIALLGIIGQKSRDIIKNDCTLFNFSLEELEKLQSHETIGKYEILPVLIKGCDIVLNKNYKAGESISILVFNTLLKVLQKKQYVEDDVPRLEESLTKFITNFTVNQKMRLIESYQQICEKLKIKNDEKLVFDYLGSENSKNTKKTIKPHEERKEYFSENHGKTIEHPKKNESYPEKDPRNEVRKKVDLLLKSMRNDLEMGKRIESNMIGESIESIYKISDTLCFQALHAASWNANLNDKHVMTI